MKRFLLLYEGVASAEDIDTVMKLGMNHPMGTLTLADFIGLDVCLAIMEVYMKDLMILSTDHVHYLKRWLPLEIRQKDKNWFFLVRLMIVRIMYIM